MKEFAFVLAVISTIIAYPFISAIINGAKP